MKIRAWCMVLGAWYSLLLLPFAYAKDITLVYTGDTHAMLYTCSCPIERDGGVARRASLIKTLRNESADTLVLDSGAFFAGGLLDEYTQSTQLDMQRTEINLKAMELMQYDAVGIGDAEFYFGKDFLQQNINKLNLPFVSSNVNLDKVAPYIIKEVGGLKIGIIGVTPLSASGKAGGLKILEPKAAVSKQVAELKKQGIDLIILLSRLEEKPLRELLDEVPGINIVITACAMGKEEPSYKQADSLILRPFWQGRSLAKAKLTVENDKVIDYKVEQLHLSDKITDEPQILAILPQCFSDGNCRKEGFIGSCQNGASMNSQCVFRAPNKVSLLVITAKSCVTCDTQVILKDLKKTFPGLDVSYLYYPEKKAQDLVKNFNILGLPVYLLAKEAEKESGFESIKSNVEKKGAYYMLKPQFSGVSLFVNRPKIKGKLDLLISLYNKDSVGVLGVLKDFNPAVHFLAVKEKGQFQARNGDLEIEEDLRSVCVQKYYPQYFWEYLNCRAQNPLTSWWDDCAQKMDVNKIKLCSKGSEGNSLLEENIKLGKELEVMFGPIYLMDNQEIFSSKGIPSAEELKEILKQGKK